MQMKWPLFLKVNKKCYIQLEWQGEYIFCCWVNTRETRAEKILKGIEVHLASSDNWATFEPVTEGASRIWI